MYYISKLEYFKFGIRSPRVLLFSMTHISTKSLSDKPLHLRAILHLAMSQSFVENSI